MALKKVASLEKTAQNTSSEPVHNRRSGEANRRKARTMAKQQQAAERVATATLTLTQGINDAVSARTQLNTATEEIAAGAEEAAGAATESLSAISLILEQVEQQLKYADSSGEKTLALQGLLDRVGDDVANLIDNVAVASARQLQSVGMMNELETLAANINDAVKQVMRIADQTNLLALNAAIEAGRAGKHGKGFAVVADTVRTLAETSETSARNIGDLIQEIQSKAKSVAETISTASENGLAEVEKGKAITQQLTVIKDDMKIVYRGSQEIATGGQQMQVAAVDAQKGAEAIASAAEEQSASAEEVMQTLEQQNIALNGAEQAAQELEVQSEELKNSTDISKSSEEVATSAEELSTSIEEINRSASEIQGAIQEINRGAEQAATASEQAASGIDQIEKGVEVADQRAKESLAKGENISENIANLRTRSDSMIQAIGGAAEQGKAVLKDIEEVEQVSRQIDKITDAIETISIKTGMLAVNGAIEAARAGEFGKGFAVVSGDIQSLADDASENIEQIKDLVKSIQDQAVRVLNDLGEVSAASLAEVETAKMTTKNFEVIETDMKEVIAGNQQILDASQEISSAVGQTKKAIEQISAAAEQASSNSTEAAAAADQQSKGAEDLAIAIEEIASVADELQSV